MKAYMGIFILSSLPAGDGAEAIEMIPPLISNLFHIPLYGGLAFLMFRTVSGTIVRSRERKAQGVQKEILRDYTMGRGAMPHTSTWVVLLVAGSYAVFDEIHQSFVPGRSASVLDFFLDLVGISAVLLFHRRSLIAQSAEPIA